MDGVASHPEIGVDGVEEVAAGGVEQLEVEIGMVLRWYFCPPTIYQYFWIVCSLCGMTPAEFQALNAALQEPLRQAVILCENMTILPSRLFFRTAEPVLREVLPHRCLEISHHWLRLLDMTREEADSHVSRNYNRMVIEPEEVVSSEE